MRKVLSAMLGVAVLTAAPIAMAQATGTGSAPAKAVQLSPEQMKKAAQLTLRNGDTVRALAFADALLIRDPKDVDALLIRAHALRAQAKFAPARDAARAGWQHATTDTEKFAAAMVMAQALSSDDKRTRAQLWLRRAAQVAPTPQHASRAARDFKYVRKQNPWQTHLSFTLAPNSNINNGSARDSSELLYRTFGLLTPDGSGEIPLSASSQALSGIETGINVQSRYRFHQTERRAHDLRMRLSYRTYHLSKSSKDDLAAEDAQRVADGGEERNLTGSDFAYGVLQVGYGFKQLRRDRRGEFSFSADIGQSFYGGERYNRYLRMRAGQTYYKNATTKLDYGLTAETYRFPTGSDQFLLGVNAGMSRKLANGDGLYLGVSLSTVNADEERSEYDEVHLRSGYVLGREIMGTALQFGLSTRYRTYDISPHSADGRQEFKVSADVTATFKQVDYFGFNPTVSLSASTTNSNIGLYDVNRVGLSIGIASSF